MAEDLMKEVRRLVAEVARLTKTLKVNQEGAREEIANRDETIAAILKSTEIRVLAEREGCAKLVETMPVITLRKDLAAAIRARGNPTN